MMGKAVSFCALALLFLASLSGCSRGLDSDLVGSQDCSPPCWRGIRPGISRSDDAVSMLTKLQQRGEGRLTLPDSDHIYWHSSSGREYSLLTKNDLVSGIELDLRTSSTIALEEIVAVYGEPTRLEINGIRDSGYFYATLFLPNRGLVFVASSSKSVIRDGVTGFIIDRNDPVVLAYFAPPADLPTVVNNLFGKGAAAVLAQALEWKGYGIYERGKP